jgi:hypothetical protein
MCSAVPEIIGVIMETMEVDPINMDLQDKVSYFVSDVFGGVHRVRKLENKGHCYVCIPHGTLATYDDDKLTRIVIASHKYGVRAEVQTNGMHGLKILLHNRTAREKDRMFERHPKLSDVVMLTSDQQRSQLPIVKGDDVPRFENTKKQRRKKLLERLREGPASLSDAGGCSREDYDLWCRSWIIPELERLIPESGNRKAVK